MNGEDWYPAHYPPGTLRGAVNAMQDFPGLKVDFRGESSAASLSAAIPRRCELTIYFKPNKDLLGYIEFWMAGRGEIFLDPLGFAGNGVPNTFYGFLESWWEHIYSGPRTGDPIALTFGSELRQYVPLFEEFYETFMKELHRPFEHHELHHDVGDYEEAIRCDGELMQALSEFVPPEKQFYVVIEKANPLHRYIAHYRKADLRGALLRYSQRFAFRGPYVTRAEAEKALAEVSAPAAETEQWAMPELSAAKQHFKRGVMPSVESAAEF